MTDRSPSWEPIKPPRPVPARPEHVTDEEDRIVTCPNRNCLMLIRAWYDLCPWCGEKVDL